MGIKELFITLTTTTVFFTSNIAHGQDPEVYTLGGLMDEDTTVSGDTIIVDDRYEQVDSLIDLMQLLDSVSAPSFEELLLKEQEKLLLPLEIDRTIDVSDRVMTTLYYLPAVYKPYVVGRYHRVEFETEVPGHEYVTPTLPASEWLTREVAHREYMEANRQEFNVKYPWVVKLNLESLPEPPKKYVASVDPTSATITVQEIKVDINEAGKDIEASKRGRKNWLHTFNGSVQFSQAYNSPNWYQGGNNNLNLLGNFVWNVKLNPKFYSKVLFENTLQYKVGVNNAPDDELRGYSISEDRLQMNTNFGLKAVKNWYYSITMQFKTQLLQNYPVNSHSLKAAFMSPGELNLGVGMTYNYTTPNKKASINLSLAPLSYNMICYKNTHVSGYRDKKVTNQYGSNLEGRFTWKPVYNISYQSRLYMFTNYEYVQGDWEHTISFEINRFLSTQIYVHLRYDSSTKKLDDTKWHRWQLKEILSFGFAYKFDSLK
ncbi:MAG: DUF3078 domain-containing protein [Clostridiales bacterium]|nr:DUF3078 domain-containing protein [Clostridiales bacterium]